MLARVDKHALPVMPDCYRGLVPLEPAVDVAVRAVDARIGPPHQQREDYVRVRMTPQFKEWLEGLADDCQLTMTDTIIQALIAFAKGRGYSSPPKR